MEDNNAAGPKTRPNTDERKDSERSRSWPLRTYLEAATADTPVEDIWPAYEAGENPRTKWGGAP